MKLIFCTLFFFSFSDLNIFAQSFQKIPEAGCSVYFPSSMEQSSKSSEGPVGELVVHIFKGEQEINKQKIKYTLQFCDFPEGAIHHDSTDFLNEFFAATIDASASSIFGTVDYSDPIKIQGYPGMIWRISYDKGKGLIKSKAFVKGSRYFNMKVEYPASSSFHPDIDKFLDSIKFDE